MKKPVVFFAVLLVMFLTLWLPACQSPQTSGDTNADYYTRDEVPNLDDPYGGFNLADEAPAFDDPVLANEFSGAEETSYDDPMENDRSVMDMENRSRRKLFLRITWGNLERDSTIGFATDWSGSLTVDRGAVLLRRVIRFEGGDRIIPRTSPRLLEWVSHTGPGFDGILVKIVPMPDMNAGVVLDDSTRVVTFSTGPLTMSFTLGELKDIHLVVPVDDAGNAVSFDAVYIDPNLCPHGFLGGIWKDDPDTVGGVFFGKWMSYDGALRGHLKGFYGVNSKGEKVFFGKYIDLNGRFKGIIRGRYDRPDPNLPGFFAGIWLDRNLQIRGELAGIWRTSDRVEGGGFFRGRWKMRCRL